MKTKPNVAWLQKAITLKEKLPHLTWRQVAEALQNEGLVTHKGKKLTERRILSRICYEHRLLKGSNNETNKG